MIKFQSSPSRRSAKPRWTCTWFQMIVGTAKSLVANVAMKMKMKINNENRIDNENENKYDDEINNLNGNKTV